MRAPASEELAPVLAAVRARALDLVGSQRSLASADAAHVLAAYLQQDPEDSDALVALLFT